MTNKNILVSSNFNGYTHMIGKKSYELANHLGNVLVTVSDARIAVDNIGTISHHEAKVTSYSDYSPFGVQLDGRTGSCGQNDTTSQTPPSISIVYQHNFDDNPSTHPYTTTPDVLDGNLSSSTWTNSTSNWTNYAGYTGKAIAISTASADTANLYLNVDVASGFELDVASFSFYHRSSTTGYAKWKMYINGIEVGFGNVHVSSGSSLASTGTLSVSNAISGLTGTVSIRIKLFDGSHGSTGTFRMDNFVLNGYTQSVGSGGGSGVFVGGRYRYQFNGMEADNEVKGNGNSYTTEFRQYDPRIGRWLSRDPKASKYPSESPYAAFHNNPIYWTDPQGDDPPRPPYVTNNGAPVLGNTNDINLTQPSNNQDFRNNNSVIDDVKYMLYSPRVSNLAETSVKGIYKDGGNGKLLKQFFVEKSGEIDRKGNQLGFYVYAEVVPCPPEPIGYNLSAGSIDKIYERIMSNYEKLLSDGVTVTEVTYKVGNNSKTEFTDEDAKSLHEKLESDLPSTVKVSNVLSPFTVATQGRISAGYISDTEYPINATIEGLKEKDDCYKLVKTTSTPTE